MRAKPLLFQATEKLGSSLTASSKASMASSYLPWKMRVKPLLFHAVEKLG